MLMVMSPNVYSLHFYEDHPEPEKEAPSQDEQGSVLRFTILQGKKVILEDTILVHMPYLLQIQNYLCVYSM